VSDTLQERVVEHVVARHLDRSGLAARLLMDLEREVGLRPIRVSSCTVLEISPGAPEDDVLQGIPEGSVVAVLGAEADPLIEEIQDSIRRSDGSRLKAIATKIQKIGDDFDRKVARAVAEAKGQPEKVELDFRASDLPTVTEIRYKEKTLVSFFAVTEDFPINFQVFAYNGGFLDREAFSLIEHHESDSSPRLACILIVRPPQLSDLEARALELVPPELSEGNISSGLIATEPVLVSVREASSICLVVHQQWVIKAARWAGSRAFARVSTDEGTTFARTLQALPPKPSAHQLLVARTEALLNGLSSAR